MLHCTMDMITPAKPGHGFRDTALFRPKSVLLVGDPALPETAILAANLAAGGFKGTLQAVGFELPGATMADSIAALPAPPDLAILSLRPDALEPAMQALAALGCLAAVVPGAAPDLAAISARTGVKALGQGSFGVAVPAIGLNATLSHLKPRPGRLALVTQSAALARAVLDWAEAEAVGFSHVIGIGGNASIGFAMALDWLSRDSGTGAVLLDIRRIRNRRAFLSAARAVARTRPVVAIRAGGRAADATGVADAVMEAALRRAGVLRVNGLLDLLTAAETLARIKPRAGSAGPGDRIGIVTNGIGLGQLAADAVLSWGGRLAELAPESLGAFGLLLPPRVLPGNPVALGQDAGARLAEVAAMMATLPEVDAVVALHAPSAEENGDVAAEAMIAAVRSNPGRAAPILVGWAGQATAGRQRHAMAEARLAVFETPEAAVRGALHLARDRANRAAAAELPARDVLDLAPDRAAVRAIFARVRAEARLALTEEEALAVLGAYGLPTVPGRRAGGPRDAADAAIMLGFPVVLKVLSPDIAHKSELGGVAIGLASAEAVQEAAAAMLARLARVRPMARIQGFLVQRQAARALELRLRLGDDAMFGPWIGFGEGGTAADIRGDEAYDLPPLNLALAGNLIGRARVARLMAGLPGDQSVNQAAVADALVRLSQVAVDFPEIAALTINPLFVDPDGVLAADAELVLRPAGETGRLAIPPYPAELARPWTAKSGETLVIRPVRPEDAAAHGEFFKRLDPQDIRYRFFSPIRELSREMTARLTQIDYDREIAFIASRRLKDGSEETLGVGRLIRDPAGLEAEYAVIVASEMKGQGLGRHLLDRLVEWGREQGLHAIMGHVLVDNAPMLAFVKSLGFTVKRLLDDPEVVETRLTL